VVAAQTALEAARATTNGYQADLDALARLRASIRALDDAPSLSGVLERLAEGAAGEAERVALLITRKGHYVGWRLAGFGAAPSSPGSIEIAPSEATLLQRACEQGSAVYEDGDLIDADTALPPFAQDQKVRAAVAMPITVGGDAVAVLYADCTRTDGVDGRTTWPAALEVLVAHASRGLEARTLQRAVGLVPGPRPAAPALESRDERTTVSHEAEVRH
jgi:transcriptional regulator with GAF, ATPase, and Fis domain